jgi:hypothetical protein
MQRLRRVYVVLGASVLMLAGSALGTTTAWAQGAAVDGNPNRGRISINAGVDFPTDYYFRGIRQETSGFIAQPYAEGTITLYKGGPGFNSLATTLGIWNSFQAADTGNSGGPNPKAWYEADLYGKVSAGFADMLELALIYTAYLSPNGAFDRVHELAVNLSFDDSKLLGMWAFSPYMLVAFELDGHADGANSGIYMEIGAEPEFPIYRSISLSIPLKLGLSLHDYYENPPGHDKPFGYFDLGVSANFPLKFIPADFGEWVFYAAGHFLAFGNATQAFNNGDASRFLGIFGISLSY